MGSLEREREDRRDRQIAGLMKRDRMRNLTERGRRIIAWRKNKAIQLYRSVYLDGKDKDKRA